MPMTSQLTINTSFEGRRAPRMNRENQFVNKHGRKHHNYKPEKAPYPMSYDRDIMDRDAIHHHMWKSLLDRPTMMTTPTYPPEKVLDLGCGVGMWTIDAARAWPNSEFVGFDLVNVQVPVEYMDPSLARRITWEHGNFLSTKLPFEDDTFDHVHIVNIARGVPEHKWSSLFEEIHRVMQPDGFIEIIEEDIIFPILPRWFTEPLHAKVSAAKATPGSPTGTAELPSPPLTPADKTPHEHALLELLFDSIYENRFINMRPTAVVPGYFTPFFSRCLSAPPLNFTMPFLAPLPPLPEVVRPSTQFFGDLDSTVSNIPDVPSYPNTRPSSTYIDNTDAHSYSSLSPSSPDDSTISKYLSLASDDGSIADTDTVATSIAHDSLPSKSRIRAPSSSTASSTLPAMSWAATSDEATTMDSTFSAQSFIPVQAIQKLGDRTRAMNLYHAFLGVLGCREAMWEELKLLQRSKKRELLVQMGWDASIVEDLIARSKFDELFERFQSDIYARIALWYSLSELGYPLPKREPLLKSELLEEERRRKAILDARASAPDDDFDAPSRVIRVFIGFKESERDCSDGTFGDE
ncbi:S-adenosyl-L-methionine-dependent methyltransferase [Artomyces pyxidatus]|uniref:S-adenosyl-L-methionine-dependent methyltransferase n=1 Tax=Artomyces pyxidatus TaxID=48021 RepID=A0ACB8TI82_9AGAM|nr:S-adenosyl-L-methionine-dependent methyltransferase [Artomyces pyxidatus]